MPRITFLPYNQSTIVESGSDLVAAARMVGIDIQQPCGAKGVCARCLVKLIEGDVLQGIKGCLTPRMLDKGYRLACCSQAGSHDAVIELLTTAETEKLNTEAGAPCDPMLQRRLEKEWLAEPTIIRVSTIVPAPQPEDGLSDHDRLMRTLSASLSQNQPITMPLDIMRTLAYMLRAQDGVITVYLARTDTGLCILLIEPGDIPDDPLGIAIDIGTTSVAARLVSLPSARFIDFASDYNSQIACGEDIISRITFASRADRLGELRSRVLDTINALINKMVTRHNFDPSRIVLASVTGNTTMIHLLLGLPPEHIRLAPYTPTVLELTGLEAGAIDLAINSHAPVFIAPAVGSYVGGDITAGLLTTDLIHQTEDVALFIDIGTNGEVVVGNTEFLMACACSAGPAFEGCGIQCGMRATSGAIDRVQVSPENGIANWWTIDDTEPLGICGSGMISLLAELFRTGWLDARGRLNRDKCSPAIVIENRSARYRIVAASASTTGRDIVLSELEIEHILRAKAAIYAACSLMLRQLGLEMAQLATIYIAGGFGRFINVEHAITIGLLPDIDRSKFRVVGNTSLEGAVHTLVSPASRRLNQEIARRITYIDLSADPAYMDEYTAALFLPHTDANRFPSVNP